ncbi:MAG: late competence development ComFB family protein [Methylococcaceae bacterium]|nr:late competence development ComFB family protein [Methylococcaceae bacterium]
MLDISNYYEQLVTDHLWKMTEESAEPLSQGFIEDVACLALNKLPTCYVRNPVDKGANLTEGSYQEMNEAVSKAIAEAVEQVRRRPHDAREG